MIKKKLAKSIGRAMEIVGIGLAGLSVSHAAPMRSIDYRAGQDFTADATFIDYYYDDGAIVDPINPSNSVSMDGDAQVLIFPYYNVIDDGTNLLQTSFNIRNTTDGYKALRLRFHEASESRDVFDFNVYMSPHDVFTLTLMEDTATGGVKIATEDTSCTFPRDINGKTFKFPAGITEIREGYLTVIEMATISAGAYPFARLEMTDAGGGTFVRTLTLAEAIEAKGESCKLIETLWGGPRATGSNGSDPGTPLPNGIPLFNQGGALSDAGVISGGGLLPGGVLASLNRAPSYAAPATAGAGAFNVTVPVPGGAAPRAEDAYFYGVASPNWMLPPTGGLGGTSIIMDIARGAAFVADPTQISGYSTKPQHYSPNDNAWDQLPSLSSGNIRVSSVSVRNANGHDDEMQVYWPYVNNDFGSHGSTDAKPIGINPFPIAHVLQAASIDNEYFIDTRFSGETDWVITFPMRGQGIFNTMSYNLSSGGGSGFATLSWGVTHPNDVTAGLQLYDREEHKLSFLFSPNVGTAASLPREVNVIGFQRADGTPPGTAPSATLLSPSPMTFKIASDPSDPAFANLFQSGWAKMDFSAFNLNFASGYGALANSERAPAPALVVGAPAGRWDWWVDFTGIPPSAFPVAPVPNPVAPVINARDGLLVSPAIPTNLVPAFIGVPAFTGVPLIGFDATLGETPAAGAGVFVGEIIPHHIVRERQK